MAQANNNVSKTLHGANNVLVLLLVVVAIIAFLGGWYGGQRHDKSSSKNNAASNLATYKNQANHFQLQYPLDWGTPSFNTNAANGTAHYVLTFNKSDSGNLKYNITLWMDQATQNAVTSASVKTVLKEKSSSVAVSDSTSYATIASVPQSKVSSLNATQIVNLSKISVTAATVTYQISGGSATCPQNKFGTGTSGNCIEKTDYNTVSQVLKSIKSL